MKKTTEDKGYGECDEVEWSTGEDKCKTCRGCDIPPDEKKQYMLMPANVDVESTRTQPVRIRVTDLSLLQTLKQTEDETPGGVIHRILEERDTAVYEGGEFDSGEDTIMKYEGVIATQTEKIRTLQREVEEQKSIINVMTSPGAKKGDNISMVRKDCDEKIAAFQDQREAMLETMQKAADDYQATLNDRDAQIRQLENELEEMAAVETDTVSAGPGTTININVFRGNPAGVV